MRNLLVALVLMAVTDKQLDRVLLKRCFNAHYWKRVLQNFERMSDKCDLVKIC